MENLHAIFVWVNSPQMANASNVIQVVEIVHMYLKIVQDA